MEDDILASAREQVLECGAPLDERQALAVLELPDERVGDALALAHEVRMRWCGPAIEVEGIVSIKTGAVPRTAISARSQGGSRRRCARSVWTFQGSCAPHTRRRRRARPSSAWWPRSAVLTSD